MEGKYIPSAAPMNVDKNKASIITIYTCSSMQPLYFEFQQ